MILAYEGLPLFCYENQKSNQKLSMILLHSNISIISGDKLLFSKETSTAEFMKKNYFSHTSNILMTNYNFKNQIVTSQF